MPESQDYVVLHFPTVIKCLDGSKKPVTDGSPLSSYQYFYCLRAAVPPLDFFFGSFRWLFSDRLVQTIQERKLTNFSFDRLILT
jgi:hypothetical protein